MESDINYTNLIKLIEWNAKKLSSYVSAEDQKTNADFPSFICKEMSQELHSPALKVERNDKRKKFLSMLLGCVVCSKQYRFNIYWKELSGDSIVKIEVYSDSRVCNHPEEQATRYLRGTERKEVAKSLERKSIKEYQDDQLKDIDKSLLKATGNMQTFKSSEVLKKAKSEQKAKKDLDSDDLKDVYLMATAAENKLVRHVSSMPFTVHVRGISN
jgi:hypothetical protein